MSLTRMTPERLAEIRAVVDERCREIETTQDPGKRGFFAIADIRALLAELDAVTRERDEWEKRANDMADRRDEAVAARLVLSQDLERLTCERDQNAEALRAVNDLREAAELEIHRLTRDFAEARKALQSIEREGGALAMLLHPDMGLPMPERMEIVAALQSMNRQSRAVLRPSEETKEK